MPFLDTLKDGISKIIPEKRGGRGGSSLPLAGGIGNHGGHGMVEDDVSARFCLHCLPDFFGTHISHYCVAQFDVLEWPRIRCRGL